MQAEYQFQHSKHDSELDEIQDGLSYLTGEPNVELNQLLTDAFIVENTDFDTMVNFFNAAGIRSENDLENPGFNDFVRRHTRFKDWEEMLVSSSNQYAMSQLNK
jgi:hypothetical protein